MQPRSARGAKPGSTGVRGTPARLTGRAVLLWLLIFFGVVIAVNAIMAKLAISTMPGTQVESSYAAGNAYNAEIAAARDQNARQWRIVAHVGREPSGLAFIEAQVRNSNEEPVDGLTFSARIERPVDGRGDRTIALAGQGGGTYRGETLALAAGQWDVVLEASLGTHRMFLSRNRVVLK